MNNIQRRTVTDGFQLQGFVVATDVTDAQIVDWVREIYVPQLSPQHQREFKAFKIFRHRDDETYVTIETPDNYQLWSHVYELLGFRLTYTARSYDAPDAEPAPERPKLRLV